MAKIVIPEPVRARLRGAMILEEDLFTALSAQAPAAVPGDGAGFRCRCQIPVPRPLDPETAELRELEVFLRVNPEGHWEVAAVHGLENLSDEA